MSLLSAVMVVLRRRNGVPHDRGRDVYMSELLRQLPVEFDIPGSHFGSEAIDEGHPLRNRIARARAANAQ